MSSNRRALGSTFCRGLVLIAMLAMFGAETGARHLKLQIQNGRVDLDADGVTIAEILAEWKRVGRTHIVNIEVLSTDLVSLKLVDVPEKFALEAILQETQGYLAMLRRAGTQGSSQYERIILFAGTPGAPLPTPPETVVAVAQDSELTVIDELPPTIEELTQIPAVEAAVPDEAVPESDDVQKIPQ